MKKQTGIYFYTLLSLALLLISASGCKKDDPEPVLTVTDIDGNVYQTITIGTQVWMAENLKVSKFRNGDVISHTFDEFNWKSLEQEGYCEYENDVDLGEVYGKLYNWYAVADPRNICPVGWHIPTASEWMTLISFLGGEGAAGNAMKEAGTSHWMLNNAECSNESTFTALPGGYRDYLGIFRDINSYGFWWCSNGFDADRAWALELADNYPGVFIISIDKSSGFSIRCVKDN